MFFFNKTEHGRTHINHLMPSETGYSLYQNASRIVVSNAFSWSLKAQYSDRLSARIWYYIIKNKVRLSMEFKL